MKIGKLAFVLGAGLLFASSMTKDSYAALAGPIGLDALKEDYPNLEIDVPYSGDFDWGYAASVWMQLNLKYNSYYSVQLDFESDYQGMGVIEHENITVKQKRCQEITKEEYENPDYSYDGYGYGYQDFNGVDHYCGYTYTGEQETLKVNYTQVADDGSLNDIMSGLEHNYRIEDMEAVNYAINGFTNRFKMYKYSRELRDYLDQKGADMTPAGQGGYRFSDLSKEEGQMYVIICPNGAYCGVASNDTYIDLYLDRVIYIPEDTPDEANDIALAIKKRIVDYLGESYESAVVVESAGLKEYFAFSEQGNASPVEEKQAYSVRIEGLNLGFFYAERDDSKTKNPILTTTEQNSETVISTESGEVPLDSENMSEYVGEASEEVLDKIDSEYAQIWNLKLFSHLRNQFISRLENGVFEVTVPVSDALKGKKLAMYYIDDNGNVESYDVVVSNGRATFRTKHFSEYILASVDDEDYNPETNDKIGMYIVFGSALVAASYYAFEQRKKLSR